MGEYIAQRIIDRVFAYDFVVSKRKDLKPDIDNYLISQNKENLIAK